MSSSSAQFAAFIGPAFVIICFAFMLYGAFCAQVCYYWTSYEDNVTIQSLVVIVGCVYGIGVWIFNVHICPRTSILETAHTGLCIQFFYEYLVISWGDPISSGKVVPTVAVTIYLVLIISSLVQGWYIYRIWHLRHQIIPVVLMIAILLAHIGLSFRATAYTNKYETWPEVYADQHFTREVNWTFGLNIALDASITAVLMYYLWRDRSQATKRSTKKMVKSLINFAFSTGALTVLTSCGFFIALNVDKHTLTFGAMIELIAKLYANSMLAMLNARQRVVQAATSGTRFGVELSNLPTSTSPNSIRSVVEPIEFRAHTVTTVITETDDTWVDEPEGVRRGQAKYDLSQHFVSSAGKMLNPAKSDV